MNIAVLGGGMVGSFIAAELSKKYNLKLYDRENLNVDNVESVVMDTTSDDFKDEIRNYDLAVNCLPGFLGFNLLNTLVETNISCVDISFMPENCLTLKDKAKNCTIIPDAGIAPGLSNLIVGNIASKHNIEKIKIMVGGLPKKKNPPWNYRAPFSPLDVIEEYTRPARIKVHNEIKTKEALSDLHTFEVEGIGELEAFLTDGLRTLLNSDPYISEIPNLSEYTIRYPGHAKMIKKLIEKGDLSEEIIDHNGSEITKKEKTCIKLFEQWRIGEEDEFTFMLIIAETKAGEEISYTVYDERTEGWSSMSRTTGLTACAFAELIISGNVNLGLYCPEILGKDETNFEFVKKYLMNRGIKLNFSGSASIQ